MAANAPDKKVVKGESVLGWADFPDLLFPLLTSKLETVDIKASRLVCSRWRRGLQGGPTLVNLHPGRVAATTRVFTGIKALDCSSVQDLEREEPPVLASLRDLQSLVVTSIYHLTVFGGQQAAAVLSRVTHLKIRGLDQPDHQKLHVERHLVGLRSLDISGIWPLCKTEVAALGLGKLQDLKLGFPSFQDASAISALANITSLTSLQIIFMGIEGFHGIGALQDAFAHMCSGLSGLNWRNALTSGRIEHIADSLSRLTRLTHFYMYSSQDEVKDDELCTLFRLTTLESLHISSRDCQPSIRSFRGLSALTRLTNLKLNVIGLSDEHLSPISCLGSLRTLCLEPANYNSNFTFTNLGQCLPLLQTLELSSFGLCEDGLMTLPTTLRELLITTGLPHPTDAMGHVLTRLTGLSELSLNSVEPTPGSFLPVMAALTRLTKFSLLNGAPVTDVDLKSLSSLTALKSLYIQGAKAGSGCAGALQKLTKLEKLTITPGNFDDEMLSAIAGLHNIRRLSALGSQISDAGLAHLAGMSAMTYLDLGKCSEVSNEGVLQHLRPLVMDHSLRTVELSSSVRNTPRLTEAIRGSLPGCTVSGI